MHLQGNYLGVVSTNALIDLGKEAAAEAPDAGNLVVFGGLDDYSGVMEATLRHSGPFGNRYNFRGGGEVSLPFARIVQHPIASGQTARARLVVPELVVRTLEFQPIGNSLGRARASIHERALRHQERELLALEEDWDGYGAAPLRAELVSEFVDEVSEAIAGTTPPIPDLVPGADGSVQAEFRALGLTLTYGAEEDGTRYFSSEAGGEESFVQGNEATDVFRRTIRGIFRGWNGGSDSTVR